MKLVPFQVCIGLVCFLCCGSPLHAQQSDVQTFALPTGWEHGLPCAWVSNDTLLFFEDTVQPGRYRPILLNIKTGVFRKLPEREDIMGESPQLSPNGKYLLFKVGGGGHRASNTPIKPRQWIAVELSSGKRMVWDQAPWGGETNYTDWMPDSRHWVEQVFQNQELWMRDVQHPSALQKITLGPPFSPTVERQYLSALWGVSRPAQALFWTDYTIGQNGSDWEDYALVDFGRKPPVVRSFSLPSRGGIHDVYVCSSRPRMAWTYYHKTQPPGSALIPVSRISGLFMQAWREIYVSDLDGNKRRSLGYVYSSGADGDDEPIAFSWSPDGKRLSFVANNTLCIVTIK